MAETRFPGIDHYPETGWQHYGEQVAARPGRPSLSKKPSHACQEKHGLQPSKTGSIILDVRPLEFGRLAPAPACCQA